MRKRTHHVCVWLDDQEYTHLKRQASLSGYGTDRFIRRLVMGLDLQPRPPDSYYAELIRQLSAIGNNLNQLAHIANATKSVSQDELDRAVEHWRRVWRLLKDEK